MRQYIDTLQDANGNALVGATCTVQTYPAGGNASIYSDNGLTPIANSSVTTGSDGQFSFFVADGDYQLVLAKGGSTYKTQAPVSIFDGAAQLTVLDSGAANAYSTSSSNLEKALRTGLRSWIQINTGNSNTGASTYSYNGLAAKSIVNPGSTAIVAGQLLAGSIYQMEYNGTAWQLMAPPGPSYYAITSAEAYATLTYGTTAPSVLTYPVGNALRYGADPTGTNDSTAALNAWIQASWAQFNYVDGQGLWSGAGGADPVLILPPGKFKVSGTLYLPASCTISGTGHPSNTVNHTRIIMNSTGLTPGRTWVANATIPAGARINAGNGYNFVTTSGGVSGGSVPTWITSAGTVTDGTVTWTFFQANQAGDNRNVPMFRFGRGSQPRTGNYPGSGPNGTLVDSAVVVTFQELEFWFVTINGTFSNPLNGVGYAVGDYPIGAVISFDVDAADCRIVDCVFQSNPCSIWGQNVNLTTATRGDGFTGGRGIGLFVENTEFDSGSAHVWMEGCYLNLWFKHCQFFATPHYYGQYSGTGCTGQVNYQGCYLQAGSTIGAPFLDFGYTFGSNSFTSLSVKGCIIEAPSGYPGVYVNNTGVCVDISQNSFFAAATYGGIYINGASAGRVCDNLLNNQGYNASAGSSFSTYIANINLQNCQGVAVTNNTICSNSAATYGGFGILTCTNGGTTSANNFVHGNTVTAPLTGGNVTNGQSQGRRINIAPGDIRGMNYENGGYGVRVGPQYGAIDTIAYTAATPDCSVALEFDIQATSSGTAFTINAPINGNVGQEIIIFIRNTSGGSLGTITWNAIYKILTFTAPINGGSATIRLRFDGTNWVQTMPQTTAVPN